MVFPHHAAAAISLARTPFRLASLHNRRKTMIIHGNWAMVAQAKCALTRQFLTIY
jgi:hypothetical protein